MVGRGLAGFAALVGVAALVAAPPAGGKPAKTTVQRTINGAAPDGGFSPLSFGPGDRYRVRDALVRGEHRLRPKRRERRRSIAYFGQISDLQLADEESPARVEWFDGDPSAGFSNSGFRPNEALNPQSIDAAVRAVNGFYKSPLRDGRGRRATVSNVMLTGDLADNMQANEVDWMRTLVEGGPLDPNSGVASAGGAGCIPGSPAENPRNYSGVQDYDDYAADNPLYYDPDDPRGAYASWPELPGLLDRAQDPFTAKGLRVPSYSVLGNHDVLFQGTIAAEPGFEQIALGCLKYTTLVPGSNAASLGSVLDPAALAAFATSNPGQVALVPGDPARAFVDRREYKEILAAGTQDDAHGFAYVDQDELEESDGHASYYSFAPRRGVRFLALDTNAEAGVVIGPDTNGSEGNVDDPQWRWLEGELEAAERRDELVLVFAHHPIQTMTNDFADELSPCGGTDAHGHGTVPSCDSDPRASTPLHLGDDLTKLFLDHRNVVAFVAGHAHRDKVTLYDGTGERGFWQIETPAIADWPVQPRLIEVFDNRDGTLSIFGTLVDTKADPAVVADGTDSSALAPGEIASLHRAMAFNDPQNGNGDPEKARGKPRDRNVELLVPDPRD
jgi:metallophosphoesterase (TIGR03767 family)